MSQAAAFGAERARLWALAYRMLGSGGDASARDLSETLDLPIARVRKHLNRLGAAGAASSQRSHTVCTASSASATEPSIR